tara:strand:+ start:2123 stop:2389 length:267 start_codon:yes stop_codon:yes gene_type:complete
MYTKAKLISKIKTATETRSFESAFFLMIVLEDSYNKYDLSYEDFVEIKKQLVEAFNDTFGLFFPYKYSSDIDRSNLVNLVMVAKRFEA